MPSSSVLKPTGWRSDACCVTETAHAPDRHEAHLPGKLFRSRRERVVAGTVFAVLTAVALGGRPLVELLVG